MESEAIHLLDYWRVLKKRKRLIGIITGAVAIVSVIVTLLLPNIYAASASLMPPQQELGMSGLLSNLPNGLGGLAGNLPGTESKADVWAGILKSQTVRDGIIERFGLRERYEQDTIEETRKALDKLVDINKSEDNDIVSITVEDEDPKLAAQMANAFIEELDKVNKTVVMSSGKRTRIFVEKRLTEAKDELHSLEDQMKSFQERNSAVKIDEQAKTIIEAIGKIKGELMAREVELQTLMSYAAPTNPKVELLKTEVNGLKRKLSELEDGHKGAKRNNSIFIPTSRIPNLDIQYARLLRDITVQQTLFELLTQQYEMSRIQEAKDSPIVQVLDYAKTPEKKSRPKRSILVLFSTFSAFSFGVFLSFFQEYIEKAK